MPSRSLPTFDGSSYWATHYRIRLRESSLNQAQRRYAEGLVEIQVASVLMHACAEVEHDLVCKPIQGHLSVEEYAILLNLQEPSGAAGRSGRPAPRCRTGRRRQNKAPGTGSGQHTRRLTEAAT